MLDGATLNSNAKGGNGVFAYGEGSTAIVANSVIKTSADNSGGIMVAGGASLTATDVTVSTAGQNSAAIRSDRGGGSEKVVRGSYTTSGKDSPAIYSAADVSVKDAELTARNAEGVVIEGENSVTLTDTDVTGNVNGVATKTGVTSNVMIYQSQSGDASQGSGSFSMTGGSFTATKGTLFYVTNTDAKISLKDVDIENSGDALLTVSGNDGIWGQEGSNNATCTLRASDQRLSGKITVASESTLALKLTSKSNYTGAIDQSGTAGTVNVMIGTGSTWKLTADSHITSLSGDTSGIDLNGHKLYVDGKVWKG